MRVTVVRALAPRQVQETTRELPDGATVAQALADVGWSLEPIDARSNGWAASVWGRRVSLDTPLREGDRLELTRPLRVDPKVARRERFQRQGARTAGLFARTPKR
ncbi:MAG: RnfH family protein [Tepidimonas sp.]|uniref:RnfH family protein n=1 Tax=Tepidimonas sp. TaxID=2002775 RepID=UPI00259EB3C0|nr:RnfH family protein [Tepidimonas sp.]MDM7455729.1 RnfH family protein [Tepidimonas sp.]